MRYIILKIKVKEDGNRNIKTMSTWPENRLI